MQQDATKALTSATALTTSVAPTTPINKVSNVITGATTNSNNSVQVNIYNKYSYATKHYANAPTIQEINLDTLKNWYEISKVGVKRLAPNSNFVKCLGAPDYDSKCTLGKLCMANYSLESNMINNFDISKCNKKRIKKNSGEITVHNNCPSSLAYAKFIASIIVHRYKKDNKQEQSIWNTDASRYSYIIKLLENNISKWKQDKKGIETQSIIVKPLITHVSYLLQEYSDYIKSKQIDWTKNYVATTQKSRLQQKASYAKYQEDRRKGKKMSHIYDPDAISDLDEKYKFENIDTNDMDRMVTDDIERYALIIISCTRFNTKHNMYIDDDMEYKRVSEVYEETMRKVTNVQSHIKEKQFGEAVIRAMSADFHMDTGVDEADSDD
jgi:hypothetical protein